MLAARLNVKTLTLSMDDVPIPEPGPGQVRVRVRAACGVRKATRSAWCCGRNRPPAS